MRFKVLVENSHESNVFYSTFLSSPLQYLPSRVWDLQLVSSPELSKYSTVTLMNVFAFCEGFSPTNARWDGRSTCFSAISSFLKAQCSPFRQGWRAINLVTKKNQARERFFQLADFDRSNLNLLLPPATSPRSIFFTKVLLTLIRFG